MKWIERQKISSLQLCWLKLLGLQEINYAVFQKMLFDSFPDHPHPLRNYAPVIPTFQWSGHWWYCCWFDIVQILLFSSLWSWCISAHTLGSCKTREPLFLQTIATLPALSVSGKTVVHTGPTQKHQQVCPMPAHTVLFPLKFLKFWAQRCLHSCLVTAWQQQRIQADFLVVKYKPLEKKWMEHQSSSSLW